MGTVTDQATLSRLTAREQLALLQAAALRLRSKPASGQCIPVAGERENLPLSSGQNQLWLHTQIANRSAAYHVPLGVRLKGELDKIALRAALNDLLAPPATKPLPYPVTPGVSSLVQ